VSAANAQAIAMLARRSLTQTFRYPRYLAPILVIPSLFLALNTGGAGQAVNLPDFPEVHGFLDFELAAAMLQSTLLAGVSIGIAMGIDIELGFMDRLMSSPVPRSTVILGRLAASAVLGLVSGTWFIAIGLIFGAHIEGGVGGALVILVLLPLAAMAFGGLGAALALRAGNATVVQGIFPLVFVILFLSTAFFPKALMQEPAQTFAAWNPLSLIADGLRDPVISSVSAGSIGRGLAGVAIVAAVSATLSALAFRHRLRAG
jgi:ABC-2 type transport system permease protein